MSKITETIRRKFEMALKAISLLVSAVCVGLFAHTEPKAKKVWAKVRKTVRAYLATLFKWLSIPAIEHRHVTAFHSFEGGKELTLALLIESIKPRAPSV